MLSSISLIKLFSNLIAYGITCLSIVLIGVIIIYISHKIYLIVHDRLHEIVDEMNDDDQILNHTRVRGKSFKSFVF